MNYKVLGSHGRQDRTNPELQQALNQATCAGSQYIKKGLLELNAKFDIFILPYEILNGSFNSISDRGGESGNDASRCYTQARYRWLEQPTIFWNPRCSVKIYSDVTGVLNDNSEVGFKRMQPRDLNNGERTLLYVNKIGKNWITKVVITATELTLPPWIVLMHELGHCKQYFEFVRKLNKMPHSEAVESAWRTFALDPGSSEPDNVGRHEKPITLVHCKGFRKRYYHDAFHFGTPDGSAYQGWGGNSPLNYDTNLAEKKDNFIFTSNAQRVLFDIRVRGLPIYPRVSSALVSPGYYRSR